MNEIAVYRSGCLTDEAVSRSTLIRLPPQELVGTFPRGEGKDFMFFVIKKLIYISVFFGFRRTKNAPRKPSLVREGGTRSVTDE